MALTTNEEALVRQLIEQNAELLNLATNEATIISKLAATKKNLGQLTSASSVSGTDISFVRQGTADKSATLDMLRGYMQPDQATETTTGVIELATTAEVLAGSDNARAATPAGLLAGLLGAGGTSTTDYVKFPYRDKASGIRREFIVQWGKSLANDDQFVRITFPIAFTSACLSVTATVESTAAIAGPNAASVIVGNVTTSSFYAGSSVYSPASATGYIYWIAIGY